MQDAHSMQNLMATSYGCYCSRRPYHPCRACALLCTQLWYHTFIPPLLCTQDLAICSLPYAETIAGGGEVHWQL